MLMSRARLVASACVVVLASVGLAGCLKEERTPIDYKLPKNFEGGFAVRYAVKDAPPLPIVDGRIQVVVPDEPNPIIVTSSTPVGGWARDRYTMDGQFLSPKLVHHSALASVSETCLFEHAVIGHRMQADKHLEAIVQKLKQHCGM